MLSFLPRKLRRVSFFIELIRSPKAILGMTHTIFLDYLTFFTSKQRCFYKNDSIQYKFEA